MTPLGRESFDPAVPAQLVMTPVHVYARLWQTEIPQLEGFLSQYEPLSSQELAAMIRVDLRERYRRNERVDVRHYFERFPALTADPEAAVDVIYAEYLARERLGEHPDLAEYEQRFPQWATVLAEQVRLHKAFDEQSASALENVPAEEIQADVPICENRQIAGPLDADYEILEEIGRGGMGVVYKARQPKLNRLVALKMVRSADLGNESLLKRFRAEAEVIASLHHPGIVQVYDFGQHEGGPYLALELVGGGTLADRLDGTPWNPRCAASMVEQLAQAVFFAHERGVVHRDLKPNNLLIGAGGDPPSLKIADFGLAKVFRDQPSGSTHSGTLLGTPSYMAPEQASGRLSEVGPAADIYALGAILYELLSGRPPFRGESAIDTLRQVLLAEPAPLMRLSPGLPRDLVTICTKCLDRTPSKRYATARELAADLRRFLDDQPIHARRRSTWEHSWRWCRRNPALAASLGSVVVLLLAVSAVSMWYSRRLSRQLDTIQRVERAERAAHHEARLRLWDSYLAEIAARNSSRQLGQRFDALARISRAKEVLALIGETEERKLQLRNVAITSLSLPDLRRVRTLWQGENAVLNGASSLAADRYAVNLSSQQLVVGQASDGKVLAQIQHGMPRAWTVLSADGRFVALTNENQTTVWKVNETSLELAWLDARVGWLTFVPGEDRAVVARRGSGIAIVEASTGKSIHAQRDIEAIAPATFHAPSRRFALCTTTDVRILSLDDGRVLDSVPRAAGTPRVAWHPSGDYLAVWVSPQPINLWDLKAHKSVGEMPNLGFPQLLQFSADGNRLVSSSLWDAKLILWDVGTAQKELELQGFNNPVADESADGQSCILTSDGNTAELWEVAFGTECRYLPRSCSPPLGWSIGMAISPDSRLLAISTEHGVELWDLDLGKRLIAQQGAMTLAEFDQSGNLIVASRAGIHHWPRNELESHAPPGQTQVKTFEYGPPERISSIGLSTSLASGQPNHAVVFEESGVWYAQPRAPNAARVRLNPSGDPRKSAVSADGRWAAIANWERTGASVWEAATGRHIVDLPIGRYGMLEFSRDGRWLATTPGGVQLWNTADWSLAHELHANGSTPNGLGIAFSPDSHVLAIGQPNGELRLTDPRSGKDWARLVHPKPGTASLVAIAPNNRRLVVVSSYDNLYSRVWNLVELRRSLEELDLDWPADVMPPSPTNIGPVEVKLIQN